MEVKVSVIVGAYNQENSIERTLKSILNQNFNQVYEIIIGEDGSKDGTRIICEKYATQYPDIIKLMPAAPNKGIMRNWKDCLARCSGEYIMACAGDDWWHNPEKMNIQIQFLDNNPDYIMCYTSYISHNVNMGIYSKMHVENHQDNTFESLLKVDYISAPTACFRKSALQVISVDEYIDNGYIMEDYPMWLDMINFGKFMGLDVDTVTYTRSSNSVSTFGAMEKQIEFEKNAQKVRRDMVEKYGKNKLYSSTYLDDIYYRNLYSHGIKFNDRRFSLKSILQVKNKNLRDLVKIIMASNSLTYYMLRQRNRDFATI